MKNYSFLLFTCFLLSCFQVTAQFADGLKKIPFDLKEMVGSSQSPGTLKNDLAEGFLLDSAYMYYEVNNRWEKVIRHYFAYDANSKQTESVKQIKNQKLSNEGWVDAERNIYIYDDEGNQTQVLTIQDFNAYNRDRVDSSRTLYFYNAKGKQTEVLLQQRVTASNSWKNSSRNLHFYDAQDRQTEEQSQYWDTTATNWVNLERSVYTYDAQGKWAEWLSQKWNAPTQSWVNTTRALISYQASDNPTQMILQSWSKSNDRWVDMMRFLIFYDTNDTLAEIARDDSTKAWMNFGKYVYSYDTIGNFTETTTQYWVKKTNSWRNREKLACFYSRDTAVSSSDSSPKLSTYFFSIYWQVSKKPIQPTKKPDSEVEKPVEENTSGVLKPPSFPGGENALRDFITANLVYPPLAKEHKIQGTVAISFVVDEKGNITAPKIIKDIGGGCGKEALRLIFSMPKWLPGTVNGEPIKMEFTLPIRFRLP